MQSFFESSLFLWGILPLIIFLARICDMSLDTMRIIMIGQGRRLFAAVIGFFEVVIWLAVARQVIVNLPNPLCFVAYAAGFACGNYAGVWIEERVGIGSLMIRIITPLDGRDLMKMLKDNGYGVTAHPAQGAKGPVNILYTVVARANVRDVVRLVEEVSPRVFYTIENVRYVNEGVFPSVQGKQMFSLWR